MPVYSPYGLGVRCDEALPGVVPLSGARAVDIDVRLRGPAESLDDTRWRNGAPVPVYVSADRDHDTGAPVLTVDRLREARLYRLRYADGIAFALDDAGRRIDARWPEPWTIDDVATYLLGSVLAFALRLRGSTCLHASAVAVDERAVAFVGAVGAGKSTLAAALARRGYPVIADDVVALAETDEGFVVHPGPPRIRLWPDSTRALFGAEDALPRLTPSWDKRFVDVTEAPYRSADRALPLAAVYLLGDRSAASASPRLEELSAAAGLMALVANTQANRLLDGRMRAQEFACLGRLAAMIGVRRLLPADDLASLSRLCDCVVADASRLAVHV